MGTPTHHEGTISQHGTKVPLQSLVLTNAHSGVLRETLNSFGKASILCMQSAPSTKCATVGHSDYSESISKHTTASSPPSHKLS